LRKQADVDMLQPQPQWKGEIGPESMAQEATMEQAEKELKSILQDLEREKRRYLDLYEDAPSGYLTMSKDGGIRRSNRTLTIILDRPKSAMTNRNLSDFIDPEHQGQLENHLRRAFDNGGMHSSVLKLSDSSRLVQLDTIPDKERPYLLRATITDVTEHFALAGKEAESARLRSILDTLPVGIIVTDEEGTVVDTNQISEGMWKDSEYPEVGNPFSEHRVYRTESDEELRPEDWPLERALKGERVDREEVDIENPDGSITTMMISSAPIEFERGIRGGAVGAFMDITRMKDMERKLERSNNDLQQFASIASHDLREPLRMVMNYLELIDKRYSDKLDDQGREFMGFALDGAKRMESMIDDILLLSQVESSFALETPVDLHEVLAAATQNLSLAIKDTGAVITTDPLPTIMAERSRMLQLIQNLLFNAIRFRSEEPPRIHIFTGKQAGRWLLGVSDNGIGIGPADHERIFQLFKKASNTKEYPGTGIGLALCKKIVEHYGGNIWVESEIGKGSTFFITLPSTRTNPIDPMSPGYQNGKDGANKNHQRGPK
jgi:signal transduction histidine kinase